MKTNPIEALRQCLNDPDLRRAFRIPEDAELDESALSEVEAWLNEPVEPLMFQPFMLLPCSSN